MGAPVDARAKAANSNSPCRARIVVVVPWLEQLPGGKHRFRLVLNAFIVQGQPAPAKVSRRQLTQADSGVCAFPFRASAVRMRHVGAIAAGSRLMAIKGEAM